MGKMFFFNILATFAEFEVDLLRMRTREGMAVAKAKGKLRGKQPKLSPKQQPELRRMHGTECATPLQRRQHDIAISRAVLAVAVGRGYLVKKRRV